MKNILDKFYGYTSNGHLIISEEKPDNFKDFPHNQEILAPNKEIAKRVLTVNISLQIKREEK